MHGEPHWQAARHVGYAQWFGFDKLRDDNRAAWAELWRAQPVVTADDPRWQEIVEAAFFYIHSSVTPFSPCNVAPFGLSRRCEYSGHVFWDSDIFVMPAILLAAPATARAMEDYRARLLPMARFNAQLNGCRGAQFPGQSGNTGFEVTPFYAGGDANLAAISITLDVAFAMAQYVHATGDDLFFKQSAWPVIQAVAEWLSSRVTKTGRGYELRHVTGPDETFDNVHNNAYTNVEAILVLREALAFAQRLGLTPPAEWADMAERFYLPIDPQTKCLLKHDGYEYQGGMCGPETLNVFWPLGYQAEPAVEAATYRFYLDRAHTYLGMPMHSSFFTVWAAQRGERKLARELLTAGICDNVVAPYHQFIEATARHNYSDHTHTVFLTNGAGLLMACYLGLPGLRIHAGRPAEWCQRPVVLPEGWESIEVERLWVRGQPMRLHARHGAARATLEPIT
jgi:hypothetical protein